MDQPAVDAARAAPPARATRPLAQAGMTLLEIMIVLAIIALVMGFLLGPRIFNALKGSQVKAAHAITKKFAYEAYPQWSMNNASKSCPDGLKELTKYMNSEDTKDPWGNEYVMLCGEASTEANGFGVVSKGKDGKDGTPDDIKSWGPPPAED
jgi:prepilin-type N-terminal cleavage/methylation domain-containing protein